MATITDIAKRPIGSYHLDDHPCVTSWPQLLSKAQLLMYIAGSKSSFSLRLDAVLQVSWTAEQVSSRIAGALENPAAIQCCCLTIGNSTLTGQNGIIGVYELVKCRITRAIHVIQSINNTNSSIGEGGPSRLYPVARLMLEVAKSRLEAISGTIDLLESEQYCSI
uniref:Uncharacterized protein n=1 Tax=Fusarium oxysporum (strain Fo5176) TaxID=660025 RepID=A0A0D2XFA6_FUSOF